MTDSKHSMRRRLAYEAARIAAEEQMPDLGKACRKAASRLGFPGPGAWPRREEIEEALRAQQRLFRGAAQAEALQRLRRRALEAMDALARFRPQLVGAALDGTADRHSTIELHLFTDDPTAVAACLAELHIPWRDADRQVRYPRGARRTQPAFRFQAGDTPIELVVFKEKGLRQPPLAPGGRRAMARAGRDAVRRMLELQMPDEPPAAGRYANPT